MNKNITYTADDEEPSCNRCDHVLADDEWCMKHCGGANSWKRYRRTETRSGENERN